MTAANRFPILQIRQTIRPAVRAIRLVGVRPEDILIVSFPRSGSTWLRFLLAEIAIGGDPEWGSMEDVVPIAGNHRRAPRVLPKGGRLVKTHDLATGPCERAVYLARDGRDITLANYRWHVRGGYDKSLDEFVPRFVAGKIDIFGSWSRHVTYWLDTDIARRGNLHVVKYEELRADTAGTLRRVLDFLGIAATDEAIAGAVEHNSLERMREKEDRGLRSTGEGNSSERFVGQGSVGAWTAKLTDEQLAAIEATAREALIRLGYPVEHASASDV